MFAESSASVSSTSHDGTYGDEMTLSTHCIPRRKVSPGSGQLRSTAFVIGLLLFVILCTSGLVTFQLLSASSDERLRHLVTDMVEESSKRFEKVLDQAAAPLFSMSQFALELDLFADLPEKIGQANASGSLPTSETDDGFYRNISGVCDNVKLVKKFSKLAAASIKNSNLDGILSSLELAPYGVVCLSHALLVNKTNESLGLDLLNDPTNRDTARASIMEEIVSTTGPFRPSKCPTCGVQLMVRLPIVSEEHSIQVDATGTSYARWGFVSIAVDWRTLVEQSQVREKFLEHNVDFQISRTNTDPSAKSNETIWLTSDGFGSRDADVNVLQSTSGNWIITAEYDDQHSYASLIMALIVLLSLLISFLVGMVVVQRQNHTKMISMALAQEAKVDVERNMTAYFAHELRNPLSAIDCALQTLPFDDVPEQSRELLVGMQLCSSFMSSIMNNLLDVRKMEEGKLELRREPCSLLSIVQDARKMALSTVSPGVELLAVAETDGRDWVLGDEPRIQQILTNLVSNAVKHTKRGSVTIVVQWVNNDVCFECRDTGPGIPKEDQLQMFERFTQRGGAPGSGLGLAIAKQMVTLMKGSIRFHSDPTIRPGTTCRVVLPLKLCEEPQEQEIVADELEPISDAFSILIVDDIAMNRNMLKRRLQKGIAPNCEVTEASTGEQALAICEQQVFDIIIVDQYMEEAGGVMVGTDVIIAMRRNMVESLIIGCSGNDLDSKFIAAGTDLIWKKPMPSNAEIIRQFRKGCAKRASPRQLTSYYDDYDV
jgi:signal transduction histidine kinase